MSALTALLDLAGDLLWHSALVFLRVGAIVALLPAFGSQSIPARVRLGLALAFTLVVAPAVPVFAPDRVAPWLFMRFLATETLAGLALGLALRLFVLALQTTGAIAANMTSLSQILGGAQTEPLPAMGQVLVMGGLALATLGGLHVQAAEAIVLSYEILPPGRFPDSSVISEWGVARVAEAFRLAFKLAAPFAILSMLYNLALGVINKAMPQLMVAFIGAPVITLGGLFLLFLASPLLLALWAEALRVFLANPFSAG
ncbi:MAG: flagellar biosynthetic protein FliR [Paracoccaceae bacterium]